MSKLVLRNSEGEIIKEMPFDKNQTNKEYMQTCNDEELGCFICENFFHGACGECRFCEITELRHHCTLGEWLKKKHKDA